MRPSIAGPHNKGIPARNEYKYYLDCWDVAETQQLSQIIVRVLFAIDSFQIFLLNEYVNTFLHTHTQLV